MNPSEDIVSAPSTYDQRSVESGSMLRGNLPVHKGTCNSEYHDVFRRDGHLLIPKSRASITRSGSLVYRLPEERIVGFSVCRSIQHLYLISQTFPLPFPHKLVWLVCVVFCLSTLRRLQVPTLPLPLSENPRRTGNQSSGRLDHKKM
jgi:hypothetical protein